MKPFEIYDALIEGVPADIRVKSYINGRIWSLVETDADSQGIAMNFDAATRPALHGADYDGMPLRDLAALSKSWNFPEASIGMAAINAWYNEKSRAEAQNVIFPDEVNGAQDAFAVYLELARGKNVATVGSFEKAMRIYKGQCNLSVLEKNPSPGDFPDSACEYILPEQDIVFITGSAFVNKTMPRLLELSRGASVVLVGPTVPLARVLFEFGPECLAGFVITDSELCRRLAACGYEISPTSSGKRVRLCKD